MFQMFDKQGETVASKISYTAATYSFISSGRYDTLFSSSNKNGISIVHSCTSIHHVMHTYTRTLTHEKIQTHNSHTHTTSSSFTHILFWTCVLGGPVQNEIGRAVCEQAYLKKWREEGAGSNIIWAGNLCDECCREHGSKEHGPIRAPHGTLITASDLQIGTKRCSIPIKKRVFL